MVRRRRTGVGASGLGVAEVAWRTIDTMETTRCGSVTSFTAMTSKSTDAAAIALVSRGRLLSVSLRLVVLGFAVACFLS